MYLQTMGAPSSFGSKPSKCAASSFSTLKRERFLGREKQMEVHETYKKTFSGEKKTFLLNCKQTQVILILFCFGSRRFITTEKARTHTFQTILSVFWLLYITIRYYTLLYVTIHLTGGDTNEGQLATTDDRQHQVGLQDVRDESLASNRPINLTDVSDQRPIATHR